VGIRRAKFFVFLIFAVRIVLRTVSQKNGIPIHDRESVIATFFPEMPRYRRNESILAKPAVSSSGDVVLTNKELMNIKKRIRKANVAPVVRPSCVILRYGVLNKTCVPELKKRGSEKATNRREEYFLALEIRKDKELFEENTTTPKQTNKLARIQKLLDMRSTNDKTMIVEIFVSAGSRCRKESPGT
jgi:hypothetical protein